MIKTEIDVLERPVAEEETQLQSLFDKIMLQNGIANVDGTEWLDMHSVDVTKLPAPAVHNFVLEVEKLGYEVGYEKRTIIKIA